MTSKLFTLLIIILFSSNSTYSFTGLLFKPLTANTFEPRIGAMYETGEDKLRLDIGSSVDLIEIFNNESSKIMAGADFFTYTRLRSEGKFKFPVETSDYFFGINGTYKQNNRKYPLEIRLRAAHISSHLVDGMAKDTVFRRMPFVYSREFIDLVGAINISQFRFYAGLNYVFSTKPKDPEPVSPQLGFDFDYEIYKHFRLTGGYDFKLIGISSVYSPVHSSQIGLLYKTDSNTGIMINLNSIRGRSIHGMFYNENDSYIGFGFQLYFY